MNNLFEIYNENCIEGMKQRIAANSIDLIFTDPPYGVEGDTLDKHYSRDETFVLPGYVDVPKEHYAQFSIDWLTEAFRVLKPSASIYVVMGPDRLREVLNAIHATGLQEVDHLVAQFTFGVYTKKKWVKSHYHLLHWVKPPRSKMTFNTNCRFTKSNASYHDRISVQILKREYKPQEIKNNNSLPEAFIEKYLLYSSNTSDVVFDPFCGSFSTGLTALRLGRKFIGFEMNKNAFDHFGPMLKKVKVVGNPEPEGGSSLPTSLVED